MNLSDYNDAFSKTVIALCVLVFLAIILTYFSQVTTNEAYADGIINDVWTRAEQRKNNLIQNSIGKEEIAGYVEESKIGRWGYLYTVLEDSTPSLVKIETTKKAISSGVCKSLKTRLAENQWQGAFDKVMVLDKLREEKVDILIHNCPDKEIPILRFYVRFAPDEIEPPSEPAEEAKAPSSSPDNAPLPQVINSASDVPTPQPVGYPQSNVSAPKPTTCPPGTSLSGRGASATSGCRCNGIDQVWNGKNCELKNCPKGSSRDTSNTGDLTNVSGCRCNNDTPKWYSGNCVSQCSGDKVFSDGECVCPPGKISKKDFPNQCVECNMNSDCFDGYNCVGNRCLNDQEEYNDCRWGICQTCDINKRRENVSKYQNCQVGGLEGMCNGNGTCYPVQGQGRRCASLRGCSAGEFCNYGGNLNSNKKQVGKFGQTPNVCQIVEPLEFTHKGITYYYNSKKDLKSWCRAANNKPNCMWGYLAKPGAESWCASLGKRLLTRSEMTDIWDVLKEHLPQTYTGYSYWVQEGAWVVDKEGRRGFNKGHPDGYGGKGGVVCR